MPAKQQRAWALQSYNPRRHERLQAPGLRRPQRDTSSTPLGQYRCLIRVYLHPIRLQPGELEHGADQNTQDIRSIRLHNDGIHPPEVRGAAINRAIPDVNTLRIGRVGYDLLTANKHGLIRQIRLCYEVAVGVYIQDVFFNGPRR